MVNIKNVLYDTWRISLAKLTGLQIVDIVGYVSTEFDAPVFKISEVVLSNGMRLDIEGEHDFPYVVRYRKYPVPNMDEETLNALYEEQD